MTVKRLVKKSLRIVLWFLGGIIVLVIVLLLLIQVPAVQQFAKQKAVSYLQRKLGTPVRLNRLRIIFPKQVVLEGIYVEDQHRDTLLAGSKVQVDISMWGLLRHKIDVSSLSLEGIRANVYRLGRDTVFNYDYIIKAFAGAPDTTTRAADTTGGFSFALGTVHLSNIVATYKDDATGNEAYVDLGDFVTHIGEFDLKHHRFSVPDITLGGFTARVRQYKPSGVLPPAVPDTSASAGGATAAAPSISLGTIHLSRMLLAYANEVSRMRAGVNLKDLAVATDSVDLARNSFAFKTIRLDSTQLTYDNDTRKRVAKGMDYNHMKVSDLVLQADRVGYAPEGSRVLVRNIAFREQSGLTLKKLAGDIVYGSKQSTIKGLVIQTDHSEIRNETEARYPSIDTLAKHLELLYVDTRLDRSTIDARDVLLFAPTLPLKGPVYINGQVKGLVSDMDIPGLEVRGLRKTVVAIKGNIKGMPNAAKAFYDVDLLRLVTDSADIVSLVPASALPATLHLPRDLSAKGRFRGTTNAFQALLDAVTPNGNAHVEGRMNLAAKSYDARIATHSLDLGYLLGQSTNVGRLTLRADARGQGFSYPTLQTDLHLLLDSGMIRGYDYTRLGLTVHFADGAGMVHSDIDDPAIKYNLDASLKGKGRYPALQLTLQLDTLDATALHLVKDTLRASALLRADFASTNPDSLQGNLDLLHGIVFNGARYLHADSIALVATHPLDSQYIHFYSEPAVLDLNGRYKLTQLPLALESTINHYYAIPGFKDTVFAEQNWDLHARITPTPLLLTFVPDLQGSDTIGLHSTFHSAAHDWRLSLATPHLRYGADTVYRFDLESATAAAALNYRLSVGHASVGGFRLHQATVGGHVADNALFSSVTLKDAGGKDWYRVAVKARQDSGYTISLDPDSLLLNHNVWTVSRDNYIHYDSSGIVAHDVRLSYKDQSMTINSLQPTPQAPLEVAFSHFQLATLTNAAGQDSVIADGTLDGKADVRNVTKGPVFTSDLTVTNLAVKSDTLGNLALKVNNEVANTYAADVTLKGKATDLSLTGKYMTATGSDTAGSMDLALRLNAFDLRAVQPFAAGQLDDIRGQLKGNMHITGTPAKFVPDGHLHFEDAVITPHITGEPLLLSRDSIEFDNTGFNFSMFALQDSAKNKATIDGNVYTTDYRTMRFDLTFNATNFRAVNATAGPDRLFYGKMNIDAAVNLEGDMTAPKMDGDLRINKQTDFTFVLPESDPEVVNRVGVVRFVDRDHPGDTILTKVQLDSLTRTAPVTGLNMSANIETDSSASFTMVIDQRNGDALRIRGRSHLNFGMDPSGKTTLTGAYEIESGSYNLTLQLLKRTFLLQRGSTITWTGDPTLAIINLIADYPINTAPIDLVENEIAGRSQTDVNKFKQKLPFTVALKMTGELLKPVITFDVTLPSSLSLQWPDVETKLQQLRNDPSELNKQVFALLLLGRFVGENPLESGAGGTSAAQMAFQSASQLLASQLNDLAASLIKGVDVNFALNNTQDYSTGQEVDQTDLAVTVSKSLFNDRVKVNVGSDFELAGAYPGQNASNIAGDLSVDYQLTKDGRYMVRAYRKNQYQVVVEGQVIETGVSFILTLDYNKFREIFGKYIQEKLEERKRKKNAK
ncbi:MAG TPA: translocation/assembly module TamB domain-containing protein [Dinghuibacter sp.]|uniref:translocation/assembly module TamB domain-containing protein n=1 Tax=Dinghuibacter sp. TaxID=2024697 RepID=UPI002BB0804E|nr:translocation/assembly module TamB domain-containing protein [Dinghuibacter sp.]HTJ14274.1 translocation/assembly module TamB domain-containing protein [Dinghuibacter sp.]